MKYLLVPFLFFFSSSLAASVERPEETIFGPVTYPVKERYGKENAYRDGFNGREGTYVVKLKRGEKPQERPDFMEFTLNEEKLLGDGTYDYHRFIACIVNIRRENSFELVLRDAKPSGFRRPRLPDRFVTMTVAPFSGTLPGGIYGVRSWEHLRQIENLVQKIRDPEAASLAAASLNLRNQVATRAEAMRALSGRRDVSAQPFILSVFNDTQVHSTVREEAATGLGMLGHKGSIPILMKGVLDSDVQTRLGSARALSFYTEEDTRGPLTEMLLRLDSMRRDAVIRAIVQAGWKPVETLLSLAESDDPSVSCTALSLLGRSGDPRALDLLLKLLDQPGRRDAGTIIAALAETGNSRAIEALSLMAKDPARRAGREADLGEALAVLGDMNSADIIVEMMKKSNSPPAVSRLQQAYRNLTGKEYR